MKLDNHQENSKRIMMSYISNNTSSTIPTLLKEPGRKNYVPWGVGDKMPSKLFSLYQQSPMHKSIIDKKVNMISGDGVQQVQDNGIDSSRMIKNPNSDDDINTIMIKNAYDLELYGLAYIEIVYSEDRKSIATMEHIDASKIRWGKKARNKLTHFYYSDNWNKAYSERTLIPIFNTTLKELQPRQIIPIITYTPSVDYYTLPSYYAAIRWIDIDNEISSFHEDNVKNGFTPTTVFFFPFGQPTEDEMEFNDKNLKDNLAGARGAKSLSFYYEPGSDNKPEMEVIPLTDADKQYEWLLKATQTEILIGHKVTNENLVGISTPGKLGGSGELAESWEIYFQDVIKGEQNLILNAINKVMDFNAMNNVEVIQNKPEVKEIQNPSFSIIQNPTNLSKIELKGEIIDSKTSVDKIKEADETGLYIWTLGAGGVSRKNCPSCIEHRDQVRTLKSWKGKAIPGHSGVSIQGKDYKGKFKFGTFCEADCTCKLIKIN